MNYKIFLKKQLENDKIHHAYLVSGQYADSESVVDYFVDILKVSSVDVLRVCGESSISINEIKFLKKELGFAPFNSLWKIAIITPAEMMTVEAQNALLKILEEPARGSVILLVVCDESGVLATIKSRCQVIKLPVNTKIWQDKATGIPDGLLAGNLSYSERFGLAEELAKNKKLILILDGWMVQLSGLLREFPQNYRYLDLIREIGETKDILKSNASNKVVLESLLMKF